MLLPVVTLPVKGLPDATKTSTLALATVLGLLFCPSVLKPVSRRPTDLLMATWCSWPFLMSGLNGQGWYEGFSHSLFLVQLYGIPYLVGRMFFRDERTVRELCWSLVVVAVAYLPLCCLEMIDGPFLHHWVYDLHQHNVQQHWRSGAWRAMVFLQHGLMVAFSLTVGYVASFGLQGNEPKHRRTLLQLLLILSLGLVLQRTLIAVLLALVGAVVLVVARLTPARPFKALLLLLAPGYLILRLALPFPIDQVQQTLDRWVGPQRAQSLSYRLVNEEAIIEHVRPSKGFFIGFGRDGWRPPNPYEPWTEVVTDSVWGRLLGTCGILGLSLWYACFLIPTASALFTPNSRYRLILGVVLLLYIYDSLLNSMLSPIYHICLGAVVSSEHSRAQSPVATTDS
jgi:hypothetical protein